MKELRKPDIAFWFDEETERYSVIIRDDIRHLDLVKAAFDLIARAVRHEPQPEIEWTEEEDNVS